MSGWVTMNTKDGRPIIAPDVTEGEGDDKEEGEEGGEEGEAASPTWHLVMKKPVRQPP